MVHPKSGVHTPPKNFSLHVRDLVEFCLALQTGLIEDYGRVTGQSGKPAIRYGILMICVDKSKSYTLSSIRLDDVHIRSN